MFKKVVVAGLLAVCGVANAATLYVDAANPNAGDGSAANPYQSIQAAVDAAAAEDTIMIAAGTYATGTTTTALGGVDSLSRVYVNKKLTLKGAGRDKTFVMGADATSPDADGLGAGAVRCLYVTKDAIGSVFEGITFKNGRTTCYDRSVTSTSLDIWEPYGLNTTNRLDYAGANLASVGGGICFAQDDATRTDAANKNIYIVDCTVTDCRAGFSGGATFGRMVLVRTLIANSYAVTCYGGAIARLYTAFSSVFAGNCKIANGMGMVNTVHGSAPIKSGSDVLCVNCTMIDNFGRGVPQWSDVIAKNGNMSDYYSFRNCIFYVNGGYRYTTGNTDCYNCAQNSYGSLSGNYATKGNIGTDYDPRLNAGTSCAPYYQDQFVSGRGNWKLHENSFLIDKGSDSYLTEAITGIPAKYLDKDFYGVARIQGTKVDMGAAEGGYAITGARYKLSTSVNYKTFVNGVLMDYANAANSDLYVGGFEDEIIELKNEFPSSSTKLYGWLTDTKFNALNNNCGWDGTTGADSYAYLFPDYDDTTVQLRVQPASAFSNATYTCQVAASVKWVSPDGDDTAAGTEAAPYRTLQKAVDASSGNGVVFAKAGVYAEGEGAATTDGDWLRSTKARVTINKNLRLVGVEGAENTVIMGRSHQVTDAEIAAGEFVNGRCGRGALRCVGSDGYYVQIQGFTLTGGAVDADPITRSDEYRRAQSKDLKSADNIGAYNWAGAGICGGTYNHGAIRVRVSDCIISNNVAYRASAACQVYIARSIITDNQTVNMAIETNKCTVVGYTTFYCPIVDSISYDNKTLNFVHHVATVGQYVNSIFDESNAKVSPDTAYAYNCIFLNCPGGTKLYGSGNVVWPKMTSWTDTDCYTAQDPGLNEEYQAAVGSPAETAGKYLPTYQAAALRMRMLRTYHGKSMDGVWHAKPASGNNVKAGCYLNFLPYFFKITTSGTGALASYAKSADYGEEFSISATEATRPVGSFKVDGVETPSLTYSDTLPVKSYASPFVVATAWTAPTLVAAFTNQWYVDAVNGNDANCGFSTALPKKTLAAAMSVSGIAAGDTVWAAPGEYKEGVMTNTVDNIASGTARIPSRVVVPWGVTLKSISGNYADTKIFGKWHSETVRQGDNAMRAVYLYTYAEIDGFTISDGATKAVGGVTETSCGGGVVAPAANRADTSYIRNCYITRCGARSGAAGIGGIYENCKVDKCVEGSDGMFYYEILKNCYIDGSDSSGNQSILRSYFGVYNCTIYTSRLNGDPDFSAASGATIENSIIWYVGNCPVTTLINAKNCIVFPHGNITIDDATCSNINTNYTDITKVMNLATGCTLVKGSPAIDAGDMALYNAKFGAGTLDLNGKERVYNNVVDIGCYEYIPRPLISITETGNGTTTPPNGTEVDVGTPITILSDTTRPVGSFTVLTNGAPVVLPAGTRSYVWTPSAASDNLSATVNYGTNWYVNANATDDTGDGFTQSTAKKTLAAIMGCKVIAGDVVWAAPGEYKEGVMSNTVNKWIGNTSSTPSRGNPFPSRVVVPNGVTLKSSSGNYADTKIFGKWHSATERQGNNAMRAVYLGKNCVLEGFTITDAATRVDSYLCEDNSGGGVVADKANSANTSYIRNCYFTRCNAHRGAAGYGGIYENCYVDDCGVTSDGVFYQEILKNCYINGAGGATSNQSILRQYYGIYNCTIYATRQAGDNDFVAAESAATIENSIIWYTALAKTPTLKNAKNCIVRPHPNITIDYKTCSNINTNYTDITKVMNLATGCTLVKGSPAIDAGDMTLYNAKFGAGTLDLNGNERVINNVVDIGCYEYLLRPLISITETGNGTTTPPNGTEVDVGTPITILSDTTRPVGSFTVLTNGVAVVLPAGARSYEWTPSAMSDKLSATVNYGNEWYVNANATDDTGDGFTQATAKKTLAAAMSVNLKDGDTVWAMPGDYNEGEMTNKYAVTFGFRGDKRHGSRVVIPTGISLRSLEGPEATTIWGRWNGATISHGPNALRAVYMYGNDLIEGFTITHGASCDGGSTFDENCGGNVYGVTGNSATPSRVVNCIITEGIARSGGAVLGCVLEHCKVYNNTCGSDGVFYATKLRNCAAWGNGSSILRYHCGVYSSSIFHPLTTGDPDLFPLDTSPIENSIIYIATIAQSYTSSGVLKYARNCVFRPITNGTITLTVDDATCSNIISNDNFAGQVALSQTDMHLRPNSVAIDKGDLDRYVAQFGAPTVDFDGTQRVYNAKLDIGCYEYDWRPQYTKDLKHRKITVTEATMNVVETANGVKLTDGQRVAIDWPGKGLPYTANFTLTGVGTLTIKDQDGTTLGTYTQAGADNCVINAPDADTKLTFAYEGTGDAVLGAFTGKSGGFKMLLK